MKTFLEFLDDVKSSDMRMDRPRDPKASDPDIWDLDDRLIKALQNPSKVKEIKSILQQHPEVAEKLEKLIKGTASRFGVNDFPPGTDIDSITRNTMKGFE